MRSMLVAVALTMLAVSPVCHAGVLDEHLDALEKAPAPAPDFFDFIIIGDTCSYVGIEPPDVFKKMIGEVNTLRPAFVATTGDMILGGSAEGLNPQWDAYLNVINKCKVPMFLTPGNHDISDEASEKIWQDRVGPTHYAFEYGNSKFIMLNSEEVGAVQKITDEQVEWLKQELENTRAKNIFLFLHQDYFASLAEGEDAERDIARHWGNVEAALAGHPVKAVFCGHEHVYRDCGVRNGIRYIITGGGGSSTHGEDIGGFHHYLWVRVRGDQVSWSVIKPGNVLPDDVMTADRVREVLKARMMWVKCPPLLVPYGETVDRDVTFTIQNPHDKAFASSFKWTVPAGWSVTPTEAEYKVAAQSQTELKFHVKADNPEAVKFPVPQYATQYEGAQFGPAIEVARDMPLVPVTTAFRAKQPVTIDADLSEWTAAKPIPLIYPIQWDGKDKNDLQCRLRLAWDADNFYVAVETVDNEHVQPYAGDIVWSADNIEFFIGKWHWGFTLTNAGPEVFLYEGIDVSVETINTDVKLAVKRDGTKTVYEAAIPARLMTQIELKPGGGCSCSMLMNDLDSRGPRHWLELTPGSGSGDDDFSRVRVNLAE